MKNLCALTIILLFASFTLAQHTDIVNQTGPGNSSTVVQGFVSSPGSALPGNEAYVDQIGGYNTADVDQFNGGFAGDEHWAKIWSQGNDNYAKVYQENSAGDASVRQVGNGNYANVFEVGNFYSSTKSAGIDAFAWSIGNGNTIVETIWGTNATAYSYQSGDGNRIDQLLGSAIGEKVEDSDFEAEQFGGWNTAYQLMDGQGWAGGITAINNLGDIETIGNDNYAEQKMKEGTLGPAANNTANAYQNGNGNYSYQYQMGVGNTSAHSQVGNGNSSTTTQN